MTTKEAIQSVMEKIKEYATDPQKSKADILLMLESAASSTVGLRPFIGEISDDLIKESQQSITENDSHPNVTNKSFEVLDIAKIDKLVKKSIVAIPSREEARYLEDIYYQQQQQRIALEGQLRALRQGYDSTPDSDHSTHNQLFLEWYLYNTSKMEEQIKKALDAFSDSCYLSKWAKSVKGIGPTIATCLVAGLSIYPKNDDPTKEVLSASSWWNYCGLNDNNRPWLGSVKSREIVNRIVEECGGVIDNTTVMKISTETQWKYSHYVKWAQGENGKWNKEKLISASAIIPYNKNLKTLMWKIGHQFSLVKNRGSLYGRLITERLAYETAKNEAGDYAEQAENLLKKKNFDKSTIAYKYYSKGQLPPAHLSRRAERYATKLFISHLYEAAYYNEFGKPAPNPYALAFLDHEDYIGPEVKYDKIKRDIK